MSVTVFLRIGMTIHLTGGRFCYKRQPFLHCPLLSSFRYGVICGMFCGIIFNLLKYIQLQKWSAKIYPSHTPLFKAVAASGHMGLIFARCKGYCKGKETVEEVGNISFHTRMWFCVP